MSRIGMNLNDYVQTRPVTADNVVASLQSSGIDVSKAKGQIAAAIKAKGKQGPGVLGPEITKIVQSATGSNSAIDADTISTSVNEALAAAG